MTVDNALLEVDGQKTESELAGAVLPMRFKDERIKDMPRTLVSFLGLSSEYIERMLDGLVKAANTHGEKPIFLITEFCFELFRSRLLTVEYLPKPFGASRDDFDLYCHYMQRRFSHLVLKWGITSEIQMGMNLKTYLHHMTRKDIEEGGVVEERIL